MTDIEIANSVKPCNIKEIAKKIDINEEDLMTYGDYKAKVKLNYHNQKAKLILVTAINPTPFGEGKTTVSIGLTDSLNYLGKKTIACLREPSMGPVFGLKGGATGGGYAQVIPMEDINLHFTGDIHAITSANNLLSSAIDNHIFRGNELGIKKVLFNRCLDVNDRVLRNIKLDNREEHFDITAASEIMAILTLAEDLSDLKERLGNIIIGLNKNDEFVYAKDLNIEGALTVLLKDAINPNLVQTLEHNPVFIHGGPFANIAHGCSSIRATKLALSLSDYVVTEAGFGADLGAEKFFDIKCRYGNIKPDYVVLVATIKALKYNDSENNTLEKGLENLEAHIDNLKQNNTNIIVCLNKFESDTDSEVKVVEDYVKRKNISFAVSTSFIDGKDGAISLAKLIIDNNNENNFNYLYDVNLSIKEKIKELSTKIYNAKEVEYTDKALNMINKLEEKNMYQLPICVAKTQYSISDDKTKRGYPKNTTIKVSDIKLYNGAGFITVYLGDILTMPGLPKEPNYEKIDLESDKIIGLS